jgi:hypothetical protein
MSEPVPSPYPPGTIEEVIWVDARGRVLPDQQGAVRGETIVTLPDGRRECSIFAADANHIA